MPGTKRSTNFSKTEEEKLVQLVLEQKHILENKKTDAVSSKQKNEAWEKLASQFNAMSENENRAPKVLKEKYQNIKRSLRKEKANYRREIFATGGGPPPIENAKPFNAVFAELSELMGVSVDGLPPRYDDDSMIRDCDYPVKYIETFETVADTSNNIDLVFENETVMENKEKNSSKYEPNTLNTPKNIDLVFENEGVVENNKTNWTKYQPSMLRKRKHQMLKTPKFRHNEEEAEELFALKKQILEEQLKHGRLEHEQKMNQSSEEHEIKMKILKAELKIKESQVQ